MLQSLQVANEHCMYTVYIYIYTLADLRDLHMYMYPRRLQQRHVQPFNPPLPPANQEQTTQVVAQGKLHQALVLMHSQINSPRLMERLMPAPMASTLKILTQNSSWMRCTATTWALGFTMPSLLAINMASPSTASPWGWGVASMGRRPRVSRH